MEKENRSKFIRYILMLCIYDFITAIIIFGTFELSKYYQFEFESWHWSRWWLFVAILVLLECIFIYLTPFFVECLDEIANRMKDWFVLEHSTDISKVESKIKKFDAKLKKMKEADRKDGFRVD